MSEQGAREWLAENTRQESGEISEEGKTTFWMTDIDGEVVPTEKLAELLEAYAATLRAERDQLDKLQADYSSKYASETALRLDWQLRAETAESELEQARQLLAKLHLRWGVRSGECYTCDLRHGKHSDDCPIPEIERELADSEVGGLPHEAAPETGQSSPKGAEAELHPKGGQK